MKKPFAIVFATLLVAHLALILSLRLYPFVDVPNHLAEATIYKYYGAATNRFADYYTVDFLLKPNVLHPLFCSLGVFPSIEFANKVYFGLYVLLLPLSTLLVIRKLGGNPWFSLFSFLLLYNHSVNWGFVGFMISIPLCLLLLPDRAAQKLAKS